MKKFIIFLENFEKNEIKLIDLIIVEIYDLREENFIYMICYDMI